MQNYQVRKNDNKINLTMGGQENNGDEDNETVEREGSVRERARELR